MSLTKIHENIRKILHRRRSCQEDEPEKSLPGYVKEAIKLGSLDEDDPKSTVTPEPRRAKSMHCSETPLNVMINDLDDVVADMMSSLANCPRTKTGSSDSGSGSSRSDSRRSSRTSLPYFEDSDTDEEDNTGVTERSLTVPGLHRSVSVALLPEDGDSDNTIGGRLYQCFDQRLKAVEKLVTGMEDSPEKFELIGSLMLNLTRMREVAEYNKNVLVLTSLVCIEEEVETPTNVDIPSGNKK